MKFEYDGHKSQINARKHGIDFEKAMALWLSPYVEFDSPYLSEPRKLLIGIVDQKCYTCIYTQRADKIRLISVRRSRKNEEDIYHEFIKETN